MNTRAKGAESVISVELSKKNK